MTDKDIRKAIREKFKNSREFAVIEEVCATTGLDNYYNVPRRIDMLVINCFASNGFYIEGIEIKISKSDLKRELMDPKKHEVFFEDIDYYTLAIPGEMVDGVKDMIPDNWGILVIDENGKARYKRKPSLISFHSGYYHKVVNRGFFASVIRGILRQQGDKDQNGTPNVEIPHGELWC